MRLDVFAGWHKGAIGHEQSKHRAPSNGLVVKSSVVKKQERVTKSFQTIVSTSPGIFSLSPERLSLDASPLTLDNSG